MREYLLFEGRNSSVIFFKSIKWRCGQALLTTNTIFLDYFPSSLSQYFNHDVNIPSINHIFLFAKKETGKFVTFIFLEHVGS